MKLLLICILLPLIGILIWRNFDKRKVPEFNDANCIRALVGEYAINDEYGMSLLAHALRNRGTLKGVYGFSAKHVLKESENIWTLAALVWLGSNFNADPVRGANEWRSFQDIKRHGMPKLKLIKIYDGIYFFKNPALKVHNQRSHT